MTPQEIKYIIEKNFVVEQIKSERQANVHHLAYNPLRNLLTLKANYSVELLEDLNIIIASFPKLSFTVRYKKAQILIQGVRYRAYTTKHNQILFDVECDSFQILETFYHIDFEDFYDTEVKRKGSKK